MKFKRVYKCLKTKTKKIPFEKLKKGDIFYMENSTGELDVTGMDCLYRATSNARPCEPKGNYGINAKPIKKNPF